MFISKLLKKENLQTLVGALIMALLFIVLATVFGEEEIKSFIERSGIWGPLVLILVKISTIVVAPLSGAPVYPLAGAFFGFFPGMLYVVIADFLGYTIAFWISRIFGQKKVEALVSKNEEGVLKIIVEKISNWKGFVVTCVLFSPVPELVSYGAGLSRISYRLFISILMPISFVITGVLVYIGDFVGFNKEVILSVLLLGVILFIVMFSVGYFFYKKKKKWKL